MTGVPDPSSARFARALAERVAEILPPPLTVRADGHAVDVYADGAVQGGSAAAAIVEDRDDGRTPNERMENAARAVLDGVQDAVSEYLTLPWPADAAGAMALPGARVDEAAVHLWFGGSEAAPAVALHPVGLDELGER